MLEQGIIENTPFSSAPTSPSATEHFETLGPQIPSINFSEQHKFTKIFIFIGFRLSVRSLLRAVLYLDHCEDGGKQPASQRISVCKYTQLVSSTPEQNC